MFVYVVNSSVVPAVPVRAGSKGVRCLHARTESDHRPDSMTGFPLCKSLTPVSYLPGGGGVVMGVAGVHSAPG